MSVRGKHFYRFTYLKSEHWSNLRLEKLASVDAVCARCKKRDLSNDVHHLNYRNLYNVKLLDLVVLCRGCHEAVHEYMDDVKKAIELGCDGRSEWEKFFTCWGEHPNDIPEIRPLMIALRNKLRRQGIKPKAKCDKKTEKFVRAVIRLAESDWMVCAERAKASDINLREWLSAVIKSHIS